MPSVGHKKIPNMKGGIILKKILSFALILLFAFSISTVFFSPVTASEESDKLLNPEHQSWYFDFGSSLPSYKYFSYTTSVPGDLVIALRDCCIRDDVVEVRVDGVHVWTVDSRDGASGSHPWQYFTIGICPGTHEIKLKNTISSIGPSGWYYDRFFTPYALVAEAGEDITIDEGTEVSFDGSGSYHSKGSSYITEYAWDLDGDNSYESFGINPSYTYCDNGVYSVKLRITGKCNQMAYDYMTVTVNNVAPAVDAGSDVTVLSGDLVCFAGLFFDPGCDTWTIDWDFGGDGTALDTLTPCHTFYTAGTYVVTLTVADDDGGVGTDTLTVTVLRIPVLIDIKPGSFPNSINLKSNGKIPVAILCTATFDPSLIDPSTVRFGPSGASPIHWAYEDVDQDGDLDLILHFKTQETGIQTDDKSATLIADLKDGRQIIGVDIIRIVPFR